MVCSSMAVLDSDRHSQFCAASATGQAGRQWFWLAMQRLQCCCTWRRIKGRSIAGWCSMSTSSYWHQYQLVPHHMLPPQLPAWQPSAAPLTPQSNQQQQLSWRSHVALKDPLESCTSPQSTAAAAAATAVQQRERQRQRQRQRQQQRQCSASSSSSSSMGLLPVTPSIRIL